MVIVKVKIADDVGRRGTSERSTSLVVVVLGMSGGFDHWRIPYDIHVQLVYNNNTLWRADRSKLLPVRDEREYESDQGHAATEYDDQREHTLLARHRPSVARQVAHDGHPSRVNALHFGDPSKIRVYDGDSYILQKRFYYVCETRIWIE